MMKIFQDQKLFFAVWKITEKLTFMSEVWYYLDRWTLTKK